MVFKTLPIALLALGVLLGTITAFAAFAPNRNFQGNDAVAQTPTPEPGANEEIQFDEIARGTYSKQTSRKDYVVNSSDEWQRIVEVSSDEFEVPVDFAKETVLVVFQGTKSTGGYGVEVSEVWEKGGKLEVVVAETSPGPGCFTIQVITSPYHIVKIPKFTGEIEFRVEKNLTRCR